MAFTQEEIDSGILDFMKTEFPQYSQPEPLSFEDYEKDRQSVLKSLSVPQEDVTPEPKNRVEDRSLLGEIATAPVRGVYEAGEMALRALRTGQDKPGEDVGWLDKLATKGLKAMDEYKAETPILQPKYEDGVKGALSQGVSSVATSLTTGLPGMIAGAKFGALGGPWSMAGGAVLGLALSAGGIYGVAQYDDVIERADKAGISRDESEPAAIWSGVNEAGWEFLGDYTGAKLLGLTGKVLRPVAEQALKQGISALFKTGLAQTLKQMGKVAVVETGSEMITGGVQSKLEKDIGLGDTDFWEGAKQAFGPSFVASIIFGGLGVGGAKLRRNSVEKALTNPEVSEEQRLSAAAEVKDTLKDINSDIADVWYKNASETIKNGEAIRLDVDAMAPMTSPTTDTTEADAAAAEANAQDKTILDTFKSKLDSGELTPEQIIELRENEQFTHLAPQLDKMVAEHDDMSYANDTPEGQIANADRNARIMERLARGEDISFDPSIPTPEERQWEADIQKQREEIPKQRAKLEEQAKALQLKLDNEKLTKELQSDIQERLRNNQKQIDNLGMFERQQEEIDAMDLDAMDRQDRINRSVAALEQRNLDMQKLSTPGQVSTPIPQKAAPSPYFNVTDDAVDVPLSNIQGRNPITTPEDQEKLVRGKEKMAMAKEGKGDKRAPITVYKRADGQMVVIDGNTTYHALKELGETSVPVVVKKTLKQQNVKSLDDVYAQAEEAKPFVEKLTEDFAAEMGGTPHFRPGKALKGRARAEEKVGIYGTFARLKDIIASTISFKTEAEMRAALKKFGEANAVMELKDRFKQPIPSGYKDVSMTVRMPNGHLSEIQFSTDAMVEAKNGPGHTIYDLMREVGSLQRPGADIMYNRLLKLSNDFYSASSNALSSDMVSEVKSISDALGEGSMKTLLSPSSLNNFRALSSQTKAVPSESKNLSATSASKVDSKAEVPYTENITPEAGNVKQKTLDQYVEEIKAKKTSGIKFKRQVEADTGDVVTVSKDVSALLRDVDNKTEEYNKLLDCLS